MSKEIINNELAFFSCTEDDIKFKNAVQDLLDLYNKEQKNKKEMVNEYNKMIYFYNDLILQNKDSISKDKIRAKIKELEEFGEMLNKKSTIPQYVANAVSIRYLKDLLEEGE